MNSSVLDELMLILDEHDFHDSEHAEIWKAMASLFNRSKKVDHLTVNAELKKCSTSSFSAAIVRVCQSVPTHHHATYYAGLVRDASVKRQLMDAAATTVRDCVDDELEPNECLSRHEARVLGIGDRELRNKSIDIKQLMLNAMDLIDARLDGKFTDSIVPTGYPDLDSILGGGLRPGNLVILAARPSMGKTAFALNVTENVSLRDSPLTTMFVSLEMSGEELSDRLLSSRSGISAYRMRSGTVSNDDRSRLVEASSSMALGHLHVVDDAMVGVRTIIAHARRVKRKFGLRLIVIDYLQLIDPVDKKVNRQEQVSAITRTLKTTARDLDVPILCLAQLNRQIEETKDHRPKLSHLRESGAIEQDADVVMFVHREEMFRTGESQESVAGLADIIVEKHRNGPLGTANLIWRREVMRFESKAPERAINGEPNRVSVFDNHNNGEF